MKKSLYRLLIVEENPHIVSVLTQTLKVDFDITVATTGKDAIRVLMQGSRFDFVITELNVSFFSGLELIELIRMNKQTGHTHIMVLSGALDSDARIACLEAGADSYMTKPFNPLEVKAKLNSISRRTSPQPELYEAPVIPVHLSQERQIRALNTNQ
ncbi:MAG: response regulator transcription factor [Bacteroidetes bacterium]|nr:response regulator transcription factor [Fibrella sp.]